jgi:hypothetical protein
MLIWLCLFSGDGGVAGGSESGCGRAEISSDAYTYKLHNASLWILPHEVHRNCIFKISKLNMLCQTYHHSSNDIFGKQRKKKILQWL